MTPVLPTPPSDQQITDFVADLASRYDRFSRNRTLDEQTGQEVILPVTEQRKISEKLERAVAELCGFYLILDSGGRNRVRTLVRGQKTLSWALWGHIGRAATHVATPEDVEWVRSGLAAASILDGEGDFRDVLKSLGALYLAATRCRIDASHWFKEAADLSSAVENPLQFNKSTHNLLLNFEHTTFFKSSIASEAERIRRQWDSSSK